MVANAHDLVRQYTPDPTVAQVKDERLGIGGPESWYIQLSANATVVELAVLMKGLGCKVRADHAGAGEFCVSPIDPEAPRPSTQTIHDILTRGFGDRLPSLLSKQAE